MKTSPPIPPAGKQGSTLVMVLVVLIIVTGICTVSLNNSMALMRVSQRQVWMEQAHFAAESGVEAAAQLLNTSGYMGASVTTFTHTLSNGETADVVVTPLNNRGKEFTVTATSTVEGITRHVTIGRIYRPTYLGYGTFYEDFRNLWWIYGNVIDGKVWTGTTQNIYGYNRSNGEKWGPVFTELNETLANGFGGYPEYASTLQSDADISSYAYEDLQFWDNYEDGYQTGIDMPALLDVDFSGTSVIADALDVDPVQIDPTQVSPDARPSGKALKLRGKTALKYSVDTVNGTEVGLLHIKNYDKFGNYNWNTVYAESVDLVYVERKYNGPSSHRGARVYIGDTDTLDPNIIKANMTVWTEDDVRIYSHMVYDDQNLETSTDKIGIISRDDIWFDQDHVGDLVMQGGYIATGASSSSNRGELGVDDYDSYVVRGTMYLLGSRVAERVYPFGMFSGSSFVSGFVTESTFDWRFETDPPPFTPTIDSKMEYENWF